MKATVEEINSVQRRLKVTVPTDSVNKAFQSVYDRIQKKAKIQGFRPGKAPLHILRKVYGETASYEVVDELIKLSLFDAIQANGINAISRPFIETHTPAENDKDYQYSAIVDVMPTLDIKNHYQDLKVKVKETKYSQKLLDKELNGIARRQAKAHPTSEQETLAQGYMAKVSVEATLDGQRVPELECHQTFIDVGAHQLFPEDLETALLGLKAPHKKSISVTLPVVDAHTDHSHEDHKPHAPQALQGKTIQYDITLHELNRLEIPNLDDELAKDLHFDSFEAMKVETERLLKEYVENSNRNAVEVQILEVLKDKIEFEVPPSIVDRVIDDMFEEAKFASEDEKKKALADQELRKSLRPEAKNRAKNTILLHEVIKQENLSVSEDEIKADIKKQFLSAQSKMPGLSDHSQQDKLLENLLKGSVGDRIREKLIFNKAADFLRSKASITTF